MISTARPQPTPPLMIAVVTETYPPDINGVALTTGRLVEDLLNLGHRIQLIRPGRPCESAPGDSSRLQTISAKAFSLPWYPEVSVGMPMRSKLIALWRREPPDVVHVITEGPLGWSAVSAAIALNLPCCSDFHTNFATYSGHYGVGWLRSPVAAYLKHLHNRSLCTIAPTKAIVNALASAGYRNLKVVGRGVDTALFNPSRRSPALREWWGLAQREIAVVHVGRLAAEKNLPLLFRAFASIRAVQPKARLIVVGDGPYRRKLVSRYPDHVFMGMKTGEELASCYASGDLFLFPSLTETYGNVTIEAMASGLAVLAFDYAAAREHIVHGVNGAVAAVGNEVAFIAQARELASDGGRLATYGAAARRTAEKLSWRETALSQIEVYVETVNACRSPAVRYIESGIGSGERSEAG